MDADRLGHRIQLTQVAQQEESGLRVAAWGCGGLVPKSVSSGSDGVGVVLSLPWAAACAR